MRKVATKVYSAEMELFKTFCVSKALVLLNNISSNLFNSITAIW